jgi:putative nucleotidyltransferase with HDIG domain
MTTQSSSNKFTVLDDLWFGDGTDEAAEKKAGQSLIATVGQIYGLRPFPKAAYKLIELTKQEDYELDEIQHVIESDPPLASRTLQVVNSAAFGLQVRCTTVNHAVRLLGSTPIREIATAIAVLEMFSGGHSEQLRDHGITVAALARYLATHCGLPTEDVYTCGLLHDLGKILFTQVQGDEYEDILTETWGFRDRAHLLERERFGFDHAVLAGHLLRFWRIPDPIPAVVAWHHQPGRAYRSKGELATLVSLIRLSDLLCYKLGDPEVPADKLVHEVAQDQSCVFLNLREDDLSKIWHDLHVVATESTQVWL